MQERESTRPLTEVEHLRKLVAQMLENQHHCIPAAQQPGFWAQAPAGQAIAPARMGAPPFPQQSAQAQVQPSFWAQWNGTPPLGYVMLPVLPSWAGPGRQYGYGGQYGGMGSSGHGVSPCYAATSHVAQTAHMTGSYAPVVSRPNVELSGVVYRVVEARVWPQFSSWVSMKAVRHPEEFEGAGVV